MPGDGPPIVERIYVFEYERFKQERSEALGRAVVLFVAFVLLLTVAVFVLSDPAFFARLLARF